MRVRWIWLLAVGLLSVVFVGLAVRGADSTPDRPQLTQLPRPAAPPPAPKHDTEPNFVFILTDDLSWNLINHRFTPHIVALARHGETFDHYFVADSLCCPSRATIFTGDYPHDTHVITNGRPHGGWFRFRRQGLARRTFAVALRRRGYATSMEGKFLNGYGDPSLKTVRARVPPGWSDWHVSDFSGYQEFNFLEDDNGHLDSYGGPTGGCVPGGPKADSAVAGERSDHYGVDVLGRYARSFIRRDAGRPFAVEVATYAPHRPFTPSPRNACDFPGLHAPRYPSFDTNNVNPPAWLGHRPPLTPGKLAYIDHGFRKRAQSVEAVDALVGRIEAQLKAEHLRRRTYIVFSSDNGFHMGEHRLSWGKMTAFDSDIRVPLIVAGPGIPHGRVVHQVVQNTDLYPTFVQLAGGQPSAAVDGHSLVPLLHPSGPVPRWPTVALVEHHGHPGGPGDPDFDDGRLGGDPTTYNAIRISAPHLPHFAGPVEAVWVAYRDAAHEHEFYDVAHDPFEMDNRAGRLTRAQRRVLGRLVHGLENCHDRSSCWKAGHPMRVRPTALAGAETALGSGGSAPARLQPAT
jgi:N-acetylglucosamine-6-sulfatase